MKPGFTHQTPLGPLRVNVVGTPTVKWGDGNVTRGARGYAGGPYPHGRLTHQYIDRCVGTLEVTISWTATWSLAGDSGSMANLTTTASLPLRTEEIQAVVIPAGSPAPPSNGPPPPPPACPTSPRR